MSFITKTLENVTRYRQFNKTVKELASLSDRELRDLGISRYQIRDIAREAVYA
jgi:uncharacterized protein YjiS (DUF1127 family)